MSDGDDKCICCDCVREAYLAQQIEKAGRLGSCSYCGEMAACISLGELADHVQTAFADHFERTANHPDSWQERAMADPESSYEWEREGEPVQVAIEEAASIPRDAAVDVLELLDNRHGDFESAAIGEETEFSADSFYEPKGASAEHWHGEWRRFEQSLKTEARFFSGAAAGLLARVFGHIEDLPSKPRRPLVVHAGPDRKLAQVHRARVFQSEADLAAALCRPDLHLGSPPTTLASAGRMNARGISVFYGATNARVALAEVRPPVGSRVAVAKFDIIRPLRLLDLTALDGVKDGGSIFDPSLKRRLERVAFLRTLGQHMTRPVMPDDEAFDYLATQAVADFLATENEPRLDGIIFGSVQAKIGRNVVLFHKCARVEEMQFPQGTEIRFSAGYETEDGWEMDYAVIEEAAGRMPVEPREGQDPLAGFALQPNASFRRDEAFRQVSLRIDAASVTVHHVESVRVNSTRFSVGRSRQDRVDPKF